MRFEPQGLIWRKMLWAGINIDGYSSCGSPGAAKTSAYCRCKELVMLLGGAGIGSNDGKLGLSIPAISKSVTRGKQISQSKGFSLV